MIISEKNILVLGASGLLGSAIVRQLKNDLDLQNCRLFTPSSSELDLLDQSQTLNYFKKNSPDIVFLAAAHVGGIRANNDEPYEFLFKNSQIGLNAVNAALVSNVEVFVNIASSCIYPKLAHQPIDESSLLASPPEVTNQWYSVAKIDTLMAVRAINISFSKRFITIVPPNLYGPGDNFDSDRGHVIPSLIRRFHEAKLKKESKVEIWGSGKPIREFMYSDDAASAILFLLKKNYSHSDLINIGSGEHINIAHLALKISKSVGYQGKITCDNSKPDGAPKKVLNLEKFSKFKWKPSTSIDEGLKEVYRLYKHSSS